MDKAALDEFFAQAEDVLTDWPGSVDAMDTGSRRDRGSITMEFRLDAAQLRQSFEAMAASYRAMSRMALAATEAMTRFFQGFGKDRYQVVAVVKHAFTPDFDLWCTHPGCLLTAEEH